MECWLEILKVGGPVLLFAVVLLYWTLKDKDRMAAELKADKERVINALIQVSAVVANNSAMMSEIKQVIQSCTKRTDK
jgi:hypothetical protein